MGTVEAVFAQCTNEAQETLEDFVEYGSDSHESDSDPDYQPNAGGGAMSSVQDEDAEEEEEEERQSMFYSEDGDAFRLISPSEYDQFLLCLPPEMIPRVSRKHNLHACGICSMKIEGKPERYTGWN